MTTLWTMDALLTPDQRIEDAFLLVEDGVIRAVGPMRERPSAGFDRVAELSGCTVLPGFVDTHIHGGGGADVMDATPEALETIGRYLVRHGVTAWLPTTITAPMENLRAALANVRAAMGPSAPGLPEILGAHLEGPYINPKMKGAQPEEFIRTPNVAECVDLCGNVVRTVTLAPEMPNALDLIAALTERGINASAGHTDATYDTMQAAFHQGLDAVTHGFNAQRGLHHREPGVVGALMANRAIRAELIADTIHVHPGAMLALFNAKGDRKIVLISDSMRGAGQPDGEYDLGGQTVSIMDGKATLSDGTIAGSVTNLADEARNMVNIVGIPLGSAARMASANPAQSLRVQHRKGYLVPGADADFVALDGRLNVAATVVRGAVAYANSSVGLAANP